jgi:hypothetical protein
VGERPIIRRGESLVLSKLFNTLWVRFGGVPEEEDAEEHGDEHEDQRHNVATHSYSRQLSLEYGGTRKSRQVSSFLMHNLKGFHAEAEFVNV